MVNWKRGGCLRFKLLTRTSPTADRVGGNQKQKCTKAKGSCKAERRVEFLVFVWKHTGGFWREDGADVQFLSKRDSGRSGSRVVRITGHSKRANCRLFRSSTNSFVCGHCRAIKGACRSQFTSNVAALFTQCFSKIITVD